MELDRNLESLYKCIPKQSRCVEQLILECVKHDLYSIIIEPKEKPHLIKSLSSYISTLEIPIINHLDELFIRYGNPTSTVIDVYTLIDVVFCKESAFRDLLQKYGINKNRIEIAKSKSREQLEFINSMSYDMTKVVQQEQYSPVYGREKEIESCIITLSRMNKCNPLLVGDAGVGKTAIVEELCRRIVTNNVPKHLVGKKVWSLQLNRVLSKTKYRGEFEEKITRLLDLILNSGDIIFLDEIHTIINAGDSEGGLSSANILKPYLARSDIMFIGATTIEEYTRLIQPDNALERRFGLVFVGEFPLEKMMEIYKDIAAQYEHYHNVVYKDRALEDILKILDNKLTNKHFPDKFIDLLDYSGAKNHGTGIIIELDELIELTNKIFLNKV